MPHLSLPPDVENVFLAFRTCEFTTLARDRTPITWPTIAFYEPDKGRLVVTTSIGLPQKAFNARRNPMVSCLFSDPTASGLRSPATVLVQGDATAPDEVVTRLDGWEASYTEVFRRQPMGRIYSSNGLMRRVFDWYYMRLVIYVEPRRVLWWPHADTSQPPREIQVPRVG